MAFVLPILLLIVISCIVVFAVFSTEFRIHPYSAEVDKIIRKLYVNIKNKEYELTKYYIIVQMDNGKKIMLWNENFFYGWLSSAHIQTESVGNVPVWVDLMPSYYMMFKVFWAIKKDIMPSNKKMKTQALSNVHLLD